MSYKYTKQVDDNDNDNDDDDVLHHLSSDTREMNVHDDYTISTTTTTTTTTSSSTNHDDPANVTADDDDETTIHPTDTTFDTLPLPLSLLSFPSLSTPLSVLFALNGLSLSLPSTALMYIVNTRAQIPLVYLSVYGAVAFLPYSLKPLYAYWTDQILSFPSSPSSSSSSFTTTSMTTTTTTTTTTGRVADGGFLIQREQLLTFLLFCSAVSIAATCLIPSATTTTTTTTTTTIGATSAAPMIWCFVLAFIRVLCSAWPEFLLGLTLLDEAVSTTTTTTASTRTIPSWDDHEDHEDHDVSLESTVAVFQSQAATARNMGSLLANGLAFFFFVYQQQRHVNVATTTTTTITTANDSGAHDKELNDTNVNLILLATAFLTLVGACYAHSHAVGRKHMTYQRLERNTNGSTTTTTTATTSKNNTRTIPSSMMIVPDTTFSKNHHYHHHHQDVVGPADRMTSTSTTNTAATTTTLFPSISESTLSTCLATSTSRGGGGGGDSNHGTTCLVIVLQILVILFAMRGPIVSMTGTPFGWNSMICLCGIIMIVIVGLHSKRWTRSTHGVGLFLIVRHAIPSGEYMILSYVYTLFQSTPMILQLLGLVSSIMTTVSSWSYGRILAPWCTTGHKFNLMIISTTVLAAILSLLNIIILHLDHHNHKNNNNNEDDDHHHPWKNFIIVTMISISVSFVREWNFLPSVILATTAAAATATTTNNNNSIDHIIMPVADNTRRSNTKTSHIPCTTTTAMTDIEMNPPSYQHMKVKSCCYHCCCCSSSSSSSMDTTNNTETRMAELSTSMQYGTLISCIDFGDQIGSWLTVPLVTALGISRENDWDHMDTFIYVTAIMSFLPLLLLPLIQKIK